MNNNSQRFFYLTTIMMMMFVGTDTAMAKHVADNVVATEKNISAVKTQQAKPLARALSPLSNEVLADETVTDELNVDKTLLLDISELKDSSGLVYFGGKVSDADLSGYLAQLKNQLGEEQYTIYRQYQAARDHQSFHVTLINPYEYQTIDKEKFKLSQKFRVTLHGLGTAKKDDKSSYFVVASSADGQFIRQNLLLNNKDFHVTLGFYPEDVYGVSKGRDTLISK